MKKYLYSALALPLLFACSSEDFDKEVISNDQFAGIEKVDAAFVMDEGATTRFDGVGDLDPAWTPQEGDTWGFAWMGDGTVIKNNPADGKAYQNHNLIQTSGIFTPQTSIYVGKYYIYRPYDVTTVAPGPINFSLEKQTIAEGYASTTQAWKNLAKTAINIGDKWTNVTVAGTPDPDPKIDMTWDKAGIKEHYNIYGAMFSNQTGLDLTYVNNNPAFAEDKEVSGATDINFTCPEGQAIGAADFYGATVTLTGAGKSFTYAPTKEPNTAAHDGSFWADKKGLPTAGQDGFTITTGTIELTTENGISTGAEGNKHWFWFNSLPVADGGGALATNVQTKLQTTYGELTINSTVEDCAYVFDKYDVAATSKEWIKLTDTDDANATPKTWNLGGAHTTFINEYGNHKGKFALTADLLGISMNGMHVKDDAHLQKALKYYLATNKAEVAVLKLDAASEDDKTFKLSKISIALLQTINATAKKVTLKACTDHNTPKIIITQEGQTGDLANATEVPALNNVFDAATAVSLSKDYTWTWSGGEKGNAAVNVDGYVSSITNEGTLTVNATNVELYDVDADAIATTTLANAKGATMNITKVTTVKNALTNLGTINVGSESNKSAELRAYNVEIKNDATKLNEQGLINNYGVVGSSNGTTGVVNNYGKIVMQNADAITLLRSNEFGANPFGHTFDKSNYKMGTVVLPNGAPNALVSVSNDAENGFIEYIWPAGTKNYSAGTVKYNTIVVSGDINFSGAKKEIQYIKFDGTRTRVENSANSNLPNLKGVIVNAGKSIIIEKSNTINCTVSAYLGKGATVYKGGAFTYPAGSQDNNYFGKWSEDQIVIW